MENELNKKLMELIEPEIECRAEKRYQEKLAKDKASSCNDLPVGHRRIVVTYDPNGDVEDLDYVKVDTMSPDDTLGANDNIALLLAAAKILARTCPRVDEFVYSHDLLDLTNDYMFGLALKKLFGG